MSNREVKKIIEAWDQLDHVLKIPHSEAEYLKLVEFLDGLTDEVGEDESHTIASLMELIGMLIEQYENKNIPELE